MAGFWALFQGYATGEYASAAWIRHGTLEGPAFAWDGAQIALPANIYANGALYTGHLAVDRGDEKKVWVSAAFYTTSLRFRSYVYDTQAATWTLLHDYAYASGDIAVPVDQGFHLAGGVKSTWVAWGGRGSVGTAGEQAAQGVWQSDDYATFISAGTGHGHTYNSGNINNPKALTALIVVPGDGDARTLVTAHTLTRLNGAQTTGWVMASSDDDGGSWADSITTYNGNQFQLECLTVLQLFPNSTNVWYFADHSGTGAYSTSNLSNRIDGDVADGPNGSYGGAPASSGCIAWMFPADADKCIAFPTQQTLSSIYSSTNGGGAWTEHARSTGHQGPFWYRGGRVAPDSLYAAGVTLPNASHHSEIWWSDDGGSTMYSAVAEEDAQGLSLDFESTPPVIPQVYEEVLTWRDSRGFVGHSRYYVLADDADEARTNAEAIALALAAASKADLNSGVGPWTTEPSAPLYGLDTEYNNIEEILRVVFYSDDGITILVELPCPSYTLFISDQETLSLIDTVVSDLITIPIDSKLCTRGGLLASVYAGGNRIMRGFRSRQNIRTLTPDETGTGE